MPAADLEIKTIDELARVVADLRSRGRRVVHCHGTFDVLHIGHIRHLKAARRLGDDLVVTITQDRFVDKGPHRPAFTERLRAEAIGSLDCVGHVAINEWPTAVETIQALKPDLYVKGAVTGEGQRDHSDAIEREEAAIKALGGEFVLTHEDVYSASSLVNRYLDVLPPHVRAYLSEFRQKYSSEVIVDHLKRLGNLRVLTIGETIIDEYRFCHVMGMSNKDPILAARHLYTQKYAGGILAVANHVSGFCRSIGLLSFLGDIDPQREFVEAHLKENVAPRFVTKSGSPTIVKRRFLREYLGVKLFEVYEMDPDELRESERSEFCALLLEMVPDYDVVIVADYGHGLFTPESIEILCERARFLAVCAQCNSGNRGYNLISKYRRADYISIDDPEARLELRDPKANLGEVTRALAEKIDCPRFMVTQGKEGSLFYDTRAGLVHTPAFSVNLVDRIGAGDAVLALTAPCVALGLPGDLIGFIGNLAGAEACSIMGHERSIVPSNIFRGIASLMT